MVWNMKILGRILEKQNIRFHPASSKRCFSGIFWICKTNELPSWLKNVQRLVQLLVSWCWGGLAFDVFGSSEVLARQASSTLLAVFTFSVAIAVVIGGVVYDLAGWRGMSVLHVCCVSGMLLIFSTEPVCLQSFREFLGRKSPTDGEADWGLQKASTQQCTSVVPVPVGAQVDDLQVEEMEPELPGHSGSFAGTQDAEALQKKTDWERQQSKTSSKSRRRASLYLTGARSFLGVLAWPLKILLQHISNWFPFLCTVGMLRRGVILVFPCTL